MWLISLDRVPMCLYVGPIGLAKGIPPYDRQRHGKYKNINQVNRPFAVQCLNKTVIILKWNLKQQLKVLFQVTQSVDVTTC